MKYIKLFEQFLITESLNIPPTPKTIHVDIELKLQKDNWSGTIIENFDYAYDLCLKLDKLFNIIVKKYGKSAKQIICTPKNLETWNLLYDTADHQVAIIREKYPAGMPPLDPEIAQSSDLVDKIQNFLDSLKPFLPDREFYQQAGAFVDEFLSTQPGSSYDLDKRKKELINFIRKIRLHNFEQKYLTPEWDEKLVSKDPNYPKSQEIFSICDEWTEFCDGGDPPIDRKDNKFTNSVSNSSSSKSSDNSGEFRRAQY
jgi:hypothetical protein